MRDYGLLNSRLGLILALVGGFMPFAVFWMRAHFMSIPKDLTEATSIDGASTWKSFRYVQIPLAIPAHLVDVPLAVPLDLEQLSPAITLIDEPSHRTMAGALLNFVGRYSTDVVLLNAGSLIIMAPTIIVFLIFQRQFSKAMLAGAVRAELLACATRAHSQLCTPATRNRRRIGPPTASTRKAGHDDVHTGDAAWWRTAVIYEIYPRSFTDANGDGHGDLPGITSRLGYLRELGVDAIWIAPWYPSPMADGGYDVSDYKNIHPLYGTLEDARELLTEAHRNGLRVILDLVANHSSKEHPWFRAALAAEPGSPERDRYIFRPGRGEDGDEPPNNWISAFRGSAWTQRTRLLGRSRRVLHAHLRPRPARPELGVRRGQPRVRGHLAVLA